MRKVLVSALAVIAVASLSGCASWDLGKGKGKAPPVVVEEPAPAPVYK
ncbi:MAG TPA: ABC transporter [Mesorhizobium sp.]